MTDKVVAASFGASVVAFAPILLEFLNFCAGADCDADVLLASGLVPAAGAMITLFCLIRAILGGTGKNALSVITTLIIISFHLVLVAACVLALR